MAINEIEGDALRAGIASELFSQCMVAFVPSSTLSLTGIKQQSDVIRDHGGEICELRTDGTIPMEQVTHVIASTIDFPQYIECQARMVPVMTPDWIIASLQRGKLMRLRTFSPDPRMIFSKVILSCADLPMMDKDTIIGATVALGGEETCDVTRMTTHICALSMDHPKCQAAVAAGSQIKIVLPHWFDDCFRLGKRINEGPYLLPDPEILRKSPGDDVDIPDNSALAGSSSNLPQRLPVPLDCSTRIPLKVFAGRAVLLSYDLALTERLRQVIVELIEQGDGRLVEDVDACDMFICHFRDGEQYISAARHCKDIGNLAWLFHLITQNEWTSPLRRLLHYPVPRNGIPGFEGCKITVSNYGGEARIYLENLVKACGATYTKTMKSDNTHLITARDGSEKCRAAMDWDIAMANHLWIEECYAKCELLPMSKKHVHFPPRTNLGEIIGQTFFDESKLQEKYYPGSAETLPMPAKRKRKLLDTMQANACSRGPGEGLVLTHQERRITVLKENTDTPKPNHTISNVFTTPSRTAVPRPSGKENNTPLALSSGSRGAKDKAISNLQQIGPDMLLYEKERRRGTKDGPWGGRRAADQLNRELDAARNSSPRVGDEDAEEGARPLKKSKTLPDIDMRIVLTGFDRWVGKKGKEDKERRYLRELGILIVQESQPCDYLAAPHLVRTVKFLVSLARGPTVISCRFIHDVLESGTVPPVQDYLLRDDDAEGKYQLSLTESVSRARANHGKLLHSVPIYCTAGIRNGPESYKAIAEAHGALFKLYKARSGTTIRPTRSEDGDPSDAETPDPVYLLSSSTPEEKLLWPRFEEMARKGKMEPRIVAADWLLDVVLRQEISFDEKFLADAFFAASP